MNNNTKILKQQKFMNEIEAYTIQSTQNHIASALKKSNIATNPIRNLSPGFGLVYICLVLFLQALKVEEDRVGVELKQQAVQREELEKEEERYWREYSRHKQRLLQAEDEYRLVPNPGPLQATTIIAGINI